MAKFNNVILLILTVITLAITIGSVSAFNLQSFSNGKTTENLTFIGNQSIVPPWNNNQYIFNISRFIRIPEFVGATISTATFNISGLRAIDPNFGTNPAMSSTFYTTSSSGCGAIGETNPANFNDRNMATFATITAGCSGSGYTQKYRYNYTIYPPAGWTNYRSYHSITNTYTNGQYTNCGLYLWVYNFNTSAYVFVTQALISSSPYNTTLSFAYNPDYVNASGAMLLQNRYSCTGTSGYQKGYTILSYDQAFDVNTTYPGNFNLTTNDNTTQLFYSSNFTTSNNKVDLKTLMNSYLSTCNYTAGGGYCFVPYLFTTATSGIVRYENIDIKAYELVYNVSTGSALVVFDTVPINTTANPGDIANFGTNFAYLNNLNLYPEYNRSANITLLGATRNFLRPVIYRKDGTYCTDCIIYSPRMDTGTVLFHVPNFNAGGYYMGEAMYYDTNLLGYWPFNVNSLTDAKDSMPFSASSPVDFIYGGVGNTGRINVTGYDQLSATGPAISGNMTRTINFWAQFLDNRTSTGTTDFVAMYSLGSLGNNTAFRIGSKNGKWFILGGNGTGGFTENDWDTGVASDFNWHMHTLIYDNTTANLTWYIDNVPRASWIHNYATTQSTQYINPAENRYTINCYQETANQSNIADGGDVECSRYYYYNGTYGFDNTTSTQWTNPQLTYDGNWGTGGSGGDDVNYSIMYINYSIPTSAQTNSQWYVKFQNLSGTGVKNLSLASCQFTTGTLRLRIFAESTNRSIRIFCANAATTWYEWTNWYNATIETPRGLVYEEAINWTLIGNKPRLLMDELAVYSRMLNSSERTSLYQGNVYAVNNNPINRFIDTFTYVNDSHPTLYVNGSYLNNWQKRRFIDRIINQTLPVLIWYIPINYVGNRNIAFVNPDNLSQSYPCYIDGYDGTYAYARILSNNTQDLYMYYDGPSRTSTDNSYYCSDYTSVMRYPNKDNIIDVFTYFNSQASLYGRSYAENFTSPGFKGSYGTSSYFGKYYTIYQEEVGIHFNKSMMQDYPGHFNYSMVIGMYQLSWNFWSGAPFFRYGNRTATLFWANANGNDAAFWYDYEGHGFPSTISRGSNRPFVINGYGNESVITHDIYYNGVFAGQFNTTWNGIEDGGFSFGGNATYKMPGNQLGVDDIVLFNRTLTQEEISEWNFANYYGPGSVLYIGDEQELNETGLPGYNASAEHALETGAINNTVNFTAMAVDRIEIENVTLTVNNQTGSLVNRTTIDVTGYTTKLVSIPIFLMDGIYNIFWTIFGHTGSSYTTPTTELDVYSTIIPMVFLPPSPVNGANTTATLYQMNLNVTYNLISQADFTLELYNESGLINTTVITPNNGPNYYNYTLTEDGYYQFRAIAINPGNVYSIVNHSIVRDTQNPTYTIIGPGTSSTRRNVVFNNTFSDVNDNHRVSGIQTATLFVTDGGSYNNLTTFDYSGENITSGQIIMPLNNGNYNYTWNVTDFSGNSFSTKTSLNVNSLPTTIEFVSPVNGANLSRNNMSFIVNVSDSTEFIDYYVWNDTGIINYSRRTAIWPYVDGINFINMTLANGYYSFNASAINAEQNAWTETRTMLIDSIGPTATVTPFNYSNLSIVNFTVYNVADNFGLFNISYTIDGDTRTYTFPGAPLSGGNFSWGNTLMQGVYPWILDIRDRSNNPYIVTGNLTVNATSPILDYHFPDAGLYVRGVPFNLTVSANASVNNITSGTIAVIGPQNSGTYNFTADPDQRRITMVIENFSVDGIYNYIGNVTDYVGNIWTVVNHNFTIDTELPFLEFITPVADYNSTTTSIFISVNVSMTNPANITYTIFNGTYSTSTMTSVFGYPTDFTHNRTQTFPTQGRWGINVTATDLAGNNNTITFYPFYVDITNPTAGRTYPNTTLTPSGSFVNNNTINFTGNASDNAGVRNVSLNITGIGNGYSSLQWVNYAFGVTYTTIGVVTTLVDGIYDWFFTSYDWANRVQNTSTQRTTVDATVPIITVTNPLNGTGVNSLNPTLFAFINDTNPYAVYGTWNLSNSTWSTSYTNFRGGCYQESTNTTNQSGKDGPDQQCNLQYNGTYSFEAPGGWAMDPLNCIDGNDGTRCSCNYAAGNCHIYANYTKPNFATDSLIPYYTINATAKFVYISPGPVFNTAWGVIPSDCMNADPNLYQQRLHMESITSSLQCWNGTQWKIFISGSGGAGYQTAEEAVNWTVSFPVPTNKTYSSLTNGGRYNLNIAVTDIVGYVGTGSSTFVVDLKAPTITLINPASTALTTYNTSYVPFAASFNDSDPSVPEISGLGNATVTINNVDYTTIYSGQATASYAMNTSYLPDGNYTWVLKVYDTAGNLNQTTGNVSIVSITPLVSYIDPTYPTGVNVSSLNLPIYLNVTLTPFANVTYRVWNATWSNFTTYNTRVYNITFIPGQGTFFYNATVTSTANVANHTETRRITLDVNAPNATIISPGLWQNNTNTNFSINATDNLGLRNATLNITGTSYSNQTTVTFSDVVQTIVSIPVALADGVYSWFWNLFDFTGNSYTTSNQQTTVDTITPTIQYESPTETSGTYLNRSTININVSAVDTNLANITIYLYNAAKVQINSTTTASTPNTIIYTVNDGVYYFNASASDQFHTNWTDTRNVTVDTTTPVLTIVYPQANYYAIIPTTLNYTYIEVNPSTCWYSTNGGATNISSTCGQNITGLTANQGNNTWMIAMQDVVGHINQTYVTFFVDTIYPTIQWTAPTPNTGYLTPTRNLSVAVLVNDTNLVNITYKISNSTWIDSTTYNYTTTTKLFTVLADGWYNYSATVTDIAGNSNSTENRTAMFDTTPPTSTVPIFNTSTESNTNFTLFNIADNLGLNNITYTLNGDTQYYNYPAFTTNGGSVSFFKTLYNGVYPWSVTIYDMVGNSLSYSGNLTVIASEPVVTFHYPDQFLYTKNIPLDILVIINASTGNNNLTNGTLRITGPQSGINGTYYFNASTDRRSIVLTYLNVSTDGVYVYDVWVLDEVGNNYNSVVNHTFTIDSTLPYLQFINPPFDYNNTALTIPITVFEEEQNPSNITYLIYNETYSNSTTFSTVGFPFNFTHEMNFTFPSQGRFTINVTATGLASNSYTISKLFYVDLVNPNASLISPLTPYVNTSSNNFTANVSDNVAVRNATLNITGTGYSNIFTTNYAYGVATNTVGVVVSLSDGVYNWFYTVYDWANNLFSTNTQQTTVDTITPGISFIAPTPDSGYNASALNITVNVSITEINPVNITYNIWNSTWSDSTTYPFTTTSKVFTVPASGLYYYNATTLDAVNHFNTTETRTVMFDVIYPTYTLINPPSTALKYYNNGTFVFNASIADVTSGLRNANLTINSNDYNTAYSGDSSASFVKSIALADAVYPWTLKIYDFSGNLNQTSGTITIDTTYPQIAFNNAFTFPTGTNVSTLTVPIVLTVTETNPANVTYSIWNSTWNNFTTLNGANYSLNFTVGQGTYYYNASMVDLANNFNTTETRTITLDVNAPNATIISPNNLSNGTIQNFTAYTYNNQTFILNTTDNIALKNATLTINGTHPDNSTYYNETTVNLGAVVQSLISIPTALADGTYNWFWRVYDFASNLFTTNTQTTLIDATNPTLRFISPTPNSGTNASTHTLFIKVSLSDVYPNNVTYTIWNLTWSNSTTYYTVKDNETFVVAADGLYYYNVSAYDLYGNFNTTETRNIVFDTLTPNYALVIPPTVNNTFYNAANNPLSFTVNINDNNNTVNSGLASATVTIGGSPYSTSYSGQDAATFLQSIPFASDGVYPWTFTVSDFAGNTNQTNGTITMHATKPVITITSPLNQTYYTISEMNYTFVEPFPSSCWYSTDGGATNISTNCGDDITGLTPIQGSNTWMVAMQDSGGNSNATYVTFLVDTVPPTIDFVNPTELNGSYLNRNYARVNVSSFDLNLDNITIYLYNYSLTNATLQNCTTFFNETAGGNQTDCINYTGLIHALLNTTTTTYTPNNLIFYNLPDSIPDLNGTTQFYSFNASASDEFSTNWTDTRYFVIDTTVPLIEYVFGNVTTPNEADNAVKSQDFVHVHIFWDDFNFANISYTIYNFTWSNTTYCNSPTLDDDNCYSFTWNNLAHEGDSYQYYATITDLAGNTNSTDTYTIFLDTVNPNATIMAINNLTNGTIVNFTYYTNPNQTFIVNVSDNFNLANATLTLNGTLTNGTNYYLQNTTNLGLAIQAIVSIPVTLSDGLYSWFWSIFDSASNLFTTTTQQTIISATGPAITINYPPANNLSTAYNWKSILVNYTLVSANPQNSTVILTGPNGYSNSSSYSYPPNLNGTTLTISQQYNFTGLLDGIYNITVLAYDYLGNLNTATRGVYITGNAPVMAYTNPTILTGTTFYDFIEVNVTATDLTPNKIITYLYLQNGSNLTLVQNTTISNQQASYVKYSNLDNGNYYFNVTAYDTFNNTATLPATLIKVEEGALDTTFCKPLLVSGYYLLLNDVNTTNGPCFTVTKPNTLIDCAGHTITTSVNDTGIVTNQGSVQVKNCHIVSQNYGINVSGGTVSLTNVTTVTTGTGLLITRGASVTATGCSIDGLYGIYLSGSSLSMTNSLIHDNTYGLYVTGSSSATLNYVNFTDNTYAIYHNVTTTFPGGSSGSQVWGPSGAGRYSNLRFTGSTTDIITLLFSNYNTFTTLTSTTGGEVRYTNSSNNQMTGGTLGSGGVILTSGSKANKFLDTTYSGSESVDSSSELTRSWTTTITTRDNQGSNVGGTTVHINDGSNKTVYTNPSGIVITDVNAYYNNGTTTVFNPYEIFGVYTDYGNSIFTDSPTVSVNSPTDVSLTFNKEVKSTLLTRQVALILMAMLLLIGLAASTGFFIVKMRNGESVADIWKYFIIMIIWDTIFLVIFLVLSKYTMQFFYPG